MVDPSHWSKTDDLESSSVELSSIESSDSPAGDPVKIGRYRIMRTLGQGGFGRVYMARDDDLDRVVAIKIPNPERVAASGDVESYLAEARALARLDHPRIVPVYDMGRTDNGLCFVVSKYIDGCDLAERLKQGRPPIRESVELAAVIAGALHHAHMRGLVHRDIKPANILIDENKEPWVADFGLALKDEDYGKGARLAGTPAYMSPEQARGEGHRVDGRSDLFSLGVVLYELLTGRKPFRGDTRVEVMDQIATAEPRPLRQIDDTIPRELERICQKALAKRASERYSTGRDMAEDLRHFLQTEAASSLPATAPITVSPPPASTPEITPTPITPLRSETESRTVKVVPKGLRSFDRHDADFFLELLPGARDRDGLPDGLRFWKTRIESSDPDTAFKVGLLYGPSGCGKSSLVKAGLLPRLSKTVLPVYIEATPDETETRLLKGLRKVCADLPSGGTTVDALTSLRRGRVLRTGEKVLIILDQFEQWLFARRNDDHTELVAALRQCDGEHVQAIVMVRDDFWMAATRFMRDLEIRLVEGDNSAAVDLFDLMHARRVLTAFGRAYGVLPEKTSELTADQRAFLEQSVAGLAQDGKVISVRLALFAEMVKGKPWTPATLKAVGGTQGVGVAFLDETFSASTAPPEHRLHQRAAQSILKALLPQTGTDIKGQMRSDVELREASGYSNRPRDFDDVIGILDAELRLITPTEPEGSGGEIQAARPAGQRYYQLTHDYLVHSLRDWLGRKQRETRRGRAELRLAERAALWDAKPENRYLPSVAEWISIRTLTQSKSWTDAQKRMMARATRVHGARTAIAVLVLAMLGFAAFESYGNLQASNHVKLLATVSTTDVPAIIKQLANDRRWADPRLRRLLAESDPDSRQHLNASLALLPVDRGQVEYLQQQMVKAAPADVKALSMELQPYRDSIAPQLWEVLAKASPDDPRLLPCASALASFDPTNTQWKQAGIRVADALVRANALVLRSWSDLLLPARAALNPGLSAIFANSQRPDTERSMATYVLTDYAADDAKLLTDLLLLSDTKAYQQFFPLVEKARDQTIQMLEAELSSPPRPPVSEADTEDHHDRVAERKARAAVALAQLGKFDSVVPQLKHSGDPRLRSFIVNWLRPLGASCKPLIAQLERMGPGTEPSRVPGQQAMDAILFDSDTSIRRALILALGYFPVADLPREESEPLIQKLLTLHRDDPDAGIHGAVEWTLKKWNQEARLRASGADAFDLHSRGNRRWYVNRQGQTFAVIRGPVECVIGSPENEPERIAKNEQRRRVLIPRSFAVSTMEISKEQFGRFLKDLNKPSLNQDSVKQFSPDQDGPWVTASWYLAAQYCNWLSAQEGLPEKEWCYLPNQAKAFDEGMVIPANVLGRTGYRLLTEPEWEYACRAGTVTRRYFGNSDELLVHYVWFARNSADHAWARGRLLPNDLGLFDMLGNAIEWCQNSTADETPLEGEVFRDVVLVPETVMVKSSRVLRGRSYGDQPQGIRSADRDSQPVSAQDGYIGMRIVRTVP